MMTAVREGHLQKWSDSKRTFKSVYAKLLSNGWFQWFDSPSSTSPKRSVDVRLVSPFLAFGSVLHQVPCKPQTFSESDIQRGFGMPHEPHKGTEMSFFVCPDAGELNLWINAITNLLQSASPAQQSYGASPQPAGFPTAPQPAGYPAAPQPAGYPAAPKPAGGFAPYPTSGGYPGCSAPAQPYPSGQPVTGFASQPGCYPPQNHPSAYAPQSYQAGGFQQPGVSNYPMAPVGGAMGATAYGSQSQYMVDKKGKPYTIIYKNGKPKKKKWKNAALGLAAGAAGGYLLGNALGGGYSRPMGMMGGGFGGGWGGGWGRRGSWSSLSSFSSFSD